MKSREARNSTFYFPFSFFTARKALTNCRVNYLKELYGRQSLINISQHSQKLTFLENGMEQQFEVGDLVTGWQIYPMIFVFQYYISGGTAVISRDFSCEIIEIHPDKIKKVDIPECSKDLKKEISAAKLRYALAKSCHAVDCPYPRACPEKHIECSKILDGFTAMRWALKDHLSPDTLKLCDSAHNLHKKHLLEFVGMELIHFLDLTKE